MIRYALVLVLATAIVGVALPAADQVATARGERAVHADIDRIESAAESLAEHDPATDGPGPRRIVTIELHDRGLLRAEADQLEFERVGERTHVTYRVDGGVTQTRFLAVPVRRVDSGPVEAHNWDGSVRLVLRLTVEDGQRVVTVEPYS